jgi:hypothetical protein
MRSPVDEVIHEIEATPKGQSVSVRAKSPGGKALLRLLDFMVRREYVHSADQAINSAVSKADQTAFRKAIGISATAKGAAEPAHRLDNAEERLAIAEPRGGPPTGPPSGTGPQWRSLGPTTIPNGQTYGNSRVNVSGRVAAVVVDPHNAAHVLCGAAGGGVWESFDRGVSWAPRTDFAPSLAIGAIAFDPNNAGVVYCGTGEGNFYWTLGAGVLKSTNGGTTWTVLATGPFVGQGFYDLKVNPSNSQHLISANTYGIYESTNGGTSWTLSRSVVSAWSISIAPGGGANAEILVGCATGVLRSVDGGTTWTAVTLPGAPASFSRVAVAIAPSNASVAYVLAAAGTTVYLWRRTPAAASVGAWTSFTGPAALTTGQAWYDWFLAVSPDNANQIYAAGIDTYRGDLSGTTWTWTPISAKSAAGSSSIHPDQHAIAFEPGAPATLYIGCDGGLFRSADRGITWTSCNNGMVITEFEYIAQNVGSSRWLIGGTQDNGTERYTGNSAWTHVMDGDGGDCAVNHDNPSIVFAEYYNISPQRSTSNGDFGTFSGLTPPVPTGEGSPFYCPYTCSSNGGNTLALGTIAVYVSRDNGTTWVRLTIPGAGTSVSALYVPDVNDVYVGTADGRILHTKWSGTSWPALTALTTPRAGAYLSSIYVDPNNLNLMVVTYSSTGGGTCFTSSNAGSAWTNRSAGLPTLPANAVEVDSRNSNRIWVGTDLGVYQSLNFGATWTNFSNGLPNVLIGDLLFHPDAWVLRAGTRNRGIWEIPVDGWMTNPVCGVQFTGTLTPNQTQTWFTFNWPATWNIEWMVMPTSLTTVGAEITWTVKVQRASNEFLTYWIQVQNLTAATVTFQGRYCILSRY